MPLDHPRVNQRPAGKHSARLVMVQRSRSADDALDWLDQDAGAWVVDVLAVEEYLAKVDDFLAAARPHMLA